MIHSDIITNQFVRINQTPASIGERILAKVIDLVIILLYSVGFYYLTSNIYDYMGEKMRLFYFLTVTLPIWAYDFLWETFNEGQSPGKYIMKIRVVNKDGSRPTLGSFFMRWLLSMIDTGLCGIGILVIILSKHSQRIGDLAAGTMIIKLVNYKDIHITLDEFYYAKKNYHPVYDEAKKLSQAQVEVIEKAIYSTREDREVQLNALSEKVERFLHVTPKENSKEKFLATLLHDYQYYIMELI